MDTNEKKENRQTPAGGGKIVPFAKSRQSKNTKICCTRYGNVMCSRGSVIPLWIDQIRNGSPNVAK